MNETPVTLVGNLTADPEIRFTPNAVAVATFTVATTPRRLDRSTGELVTGETLYMRCSIWREYAEHVTDSLSKGMHVIVTGYLKSRTFTTRDDERRTVVEMDVMEIGPTLRFATARVQRLTRREAPGGESRPDGQPTSSGAASQYADDGDGRWSPPAGYGARTGTTTT